MRTVKQANFAMYAAVKMLRYFRGKKPTIGEFIEYGYREFILRVPAPIITKQEFDHIGFVIPLFSELPNLTIVVQRLNKPISIPERIFEISKAKLLSRRVSLALLYSGFLSSLSYKESYPVKQDYDPVAKTIRKFKLPKWAVPFIEEWYYNEKIPNDKSFPKATASEHRNKKTLFGLDALSQRRLTRYYNKIDLDSLILH